jgi:ribonuclease HI
LETAARRQMTPERVTIFTDAQAVIRRMASEEPGPGQMYAIQARKHIATLRRARPDIIVEIRWCPAHQGAPENEKADEWAKLAAEEPGARGVEWLQAGARPSLREQVERSPLLGWKPSHHQEVQAAAQAAARQESGRQLQEACL